MDLVFVKTYVWTESPHILSKDEISKANIGDRFKLAQHLVEKESREVFVAQR